MNDNNVENFDINEKENNYGHNIDPKIKAKLDAKNNTDEYLIRKFIGKNADKILGGSINIGALFFGPLYYFYRKMYLYGIILIALYYGSTFLPFKYGGVILSLFLLFFTNKIYTDFVYGQVQSIKKINKDIDKDKLGVECFKSGGTSFLGVIVCVIFTLIVLYFMGIFNTKIDIPKYY